TPGTAEGRVEECSAIEVQARLAQVDKILAHQAARDGQTWSRPGVAADGSLLFHEVNSFVQLFGHLELAVPYEAVHLQPMGDLEEAGGRQHGREENQQQPEHWIGAGDR